MNTINTRIQATIIMALYLSKTTFDPLVVSWIGTAIAVGYAAYLTYSNAKDKGSVSQSKGKSLINLDVKKDQAKVVDTVDVEDLGNKAVFCRCWRSKKFPYCDGAHAAHNKECGDNIGPLIVQKRDINPTPTEK